MVSFTTGSLRRAGWVEGRIMGTRNDVFFTEIQIVIEMYLCIFYYYK
jgi:hypothetical protein